MRCPDCNKFVPFEEGNVEDVEVEIDEQSGAVSIQGPVRLPCGECGTDLKEYNFEETVETEEAFPDPAESIKREIGKEVDDEWIEKNVEIRFELDGEPEKEYTEEVKSTYTDKKGNVKKIKNSRYMKTLKGVAVSGTVKRIMTCSEWESDIEDSHEFETTLTEQASAFDELT
jgi:hypothetical protein